MAGKTTICDLENLDTSQVTDMSYMFYDYRSLQSLELKNFNTGNVTSMQGMFETRLICTINTGTTWNIWM